MNDRVVAVGDLGSDEVGSGARMNGGKPAVELIPVRVWIDILFRHVDLVDPFQDLYYSLSDLAEFQEGSDSAILDAIMLHGTDDWDACCAVFDYGRRKYAEWNWLKGMPWSVPTACAVRHARKIVAGQQLDDESNLPHIGHYLCNLVMLATFARTYPQGDDRPPAKYFGADKDVVIRPGMCISGE